MSSVYIYIDSADKSAGKQIQGIKCWDCKMMKWHDKFIT